jgi:molecular chaperone GrpE
VVISLVKKALFPEEFTIDQQPEPVFVPVEPEAGEAAGGEEEKRPASEAVLDALFHSGRAQDLLSQMEALLLEQERLAEKARLLEMKGAGNDEFGKFAKQVLPFMDNFAHLLDMAREHPPSEEINNWLKSIEALYFRMASLLESYDLRFINSFGKVVDLDMHEVIDYRFTDQFPHNTVIKELQKGVVFRGRLIRDAKVVVACNPNSESSR